MRQRADDVVRLVSLDRNRRNPEGLDDLLDIRHLDDERVGHRLALCLVRGEDLLPVGRPLGIEDNGKPVRPLIPDDFQEHLDEPVDRVGRKSLGCGKAPDGVESAVDVGVAVDDMEAGPGQHRISRQRGTATQ